MLSLSRSSVHFTIHKLLITFHSHILCYKESMVKIKVETLMEISVFGYCPLENVVVYLSKCPFVRMRMEKNYSIDSHHIHQHISTGARERFVRHF